MYTRCPGCGAEISFEPPANRESLPEDYKHRIRCPICGVTIGVKINKPIYTTTTVPNYGPQPVATSFEPLVPQQPVAPVVQKPVARPQQTAPSQRQATVQTSAKNSKKSKAKAVPKKSGIGRNIMMMLFSLLFVAISVVGYLMNNGTIPELSGILGIFNAISLFDGILPIELMIKEIDVVKLMFETGIGNGIMFIVPSALFVFAGVNFIVALISAIGKKYGRAYNLIMSIAICGLAVASFFMPYVLGGDKGLISYFLNVVKGGMYLMFVPVGLGLWQLIFSLFFLKSLKKKKKKNVRK